MRFLADEGVDGLIVAFIRDDENDVRWMAEEVEGTKDKVVLDLAVRDARVLITEDKDFGELVDRQRLYHRGVVLVRVVGAWRLRLNKSLRCSRTLSRSVGPHPRSSEENPARCARSLTRRRTSPQR